MAASSYIINLVINNSCCLCAAAHHVSTQTNICTTDWSERETMAMTGDWSTHNTEKLKHHLTLHSTGIITISITSPQGVGMCSDTVNISTISPPSSSAPRQASSKNKVFKGHNCLHRKDPLELQQLCTGTAFRCRNTSCV